MEVDKNYINLIHGDLVKALEFRKLENKENPPVVRTACIRYNKHNMTYIVTTPYYLQEEPHESDIYPPRRPGLQH